MRREPITLHWADHRLSGRFRLQTEVGWALFALMVLCCLCLSLAQLPEGWRPLQNLAALLQAFASGLVAAQWLPIWDRDSPSSSGRVEPTMDKF